MSPEYQRDARESQYPQGLVRMSGLLGKSLWGGGVAAEVSLFRNITEFSAADELLPGLECPLVEFVTIPFGKGSLFGSTFSQETLDSNEIIALDFVFE